MANDSAPVFVFFSLCPAHPPRPSISPPERTTYSIGDSETTNQNNHWRSKHYDHWFDYEKLPGLKGKSAAEIALEKDQERVAGKKKQANIASFLAVSSVSISC